MTSKLATSCHANIGPGERRKRLVVGIGMLAVGVGLGVGLIVTDVPRWWRIGLLIPFWLGALGLFEAKERTCVVLAARGVRNLDRGEERIAEQGVQTQVRARALNVHILSVFTAALLTLACLLIPTGHE